VIFLSFFVFGAVAPFILTLGYIWVDTFRPQDVAWFVMDQLPVAQLTGFAAVAGYVLLDRRSPPRFTFATLLVLLLACWITLTMLWAEVPSAGWSKWDWAFKSVLFSAFIPWAIRSRVQIEAFVQIYVLALAANFVPFGAKVIISGGGYGQNLVPPVIDSAVDFRIDGSAMTEMHRDRETDCREEVCGEAQR
jgi:hypothetical protein